MLNYFISFQTWFHVKIKFFKIILFHFKRGSMLKYNYLGRSTDGGGWGLKFFKIIFVLHGTTALLSFS